MKKGFQWWIFQPYKWLIAFPFFILNTFFWCLMCVLVVTLAGAKVGSLCGVWWAKLTGWVCFFKLKVEGRNQVDLSKSYVIVVNHQSAFDIIAIYGWLGIDFRWVMKQELRKIPLFGYTCYRLGHIYINRHNSQEAVKALQNAKSVLVDGTSVLFFPEGTRTATSELSPFKKGAFKMAIDLGLPILPVTLKNVDKVLPTQTLDLLPGKAEMIFHEPISTDELGEKDITKLMQDCRTVMATPLTE